MKRNKQGKYEILIDYDYREDKLLITPNSVEIPQGSTINWNILPKNLIKSQISNLKNLRWTLYFEREDSPFYWTNVSIDLNNLLEDSHTKIKLADGMAEKKGEFKYGVKVSQKNFNEPLYDEDPIIIIY